MVNCQILLGLCPEFDKSLCAQSGQVVLLGAEHEHDSSEIAREICLLFGHVCRAFVQGKLRLASTPQRTKNA